MSLGPLETDRAVPRPGIWLIFFAAMLLAAGLSLWFGRNVTFTGDELSIISLVTDLEPGELFDPYVGHLIPVGFLAYKALLETVGTSDYSLFQGATVGSILLLGTGVLCWGSRRVPDFVALAPTLVLILFTGDLLHFVAGNGFIIIFPLACGVWALNAWDRGTRLGDFIALVLLTIAMMTYTVGVAFAIGLAVAALIQNKRRIWVAGIPLLVYALWRLLAAADSVEIEDTGPGWANLLLLPAWAFQAIGAVLESLVGVGFNFGIEQGVNEATLTGSLSPVLAVGFTILILLRFRSGGPPASFWAVTAVAVGLFTSQVLVWGSFEARAEPTEPRYLYPGALVVILMVIELLRGIDWTRGKLATLWGIAVVAIVSSIGVLINSVERLEVGTNMSKAQATGAYIIQTLPNPPPPDRQPRTSIRASFDPSSTAGLPTLSFDETKLDQVEPKYSKEVDRFLAETLRLRLVPAKGSVPAGPCLPAVVSSTTQQLTRARIPAGGALLDSSRSLDLRLGRYGKNASLRLGFLWGGQPATLRIPTDAGTRPWFIQISNGSSGTLEDLEFCRLPRG